ncbi:MAG: winged helix-turn-helix domain-containing protein, partial [Dehalococcoidia bacterium]
MAVRRESLSLAQARRIALAAQGFAEPAASGPPDVRRLRRAAERLGVLQVDS